MIDCDSANAGSHHAHSAAGPLTRTTSILFMITFESSEILPSTESPCQIGPPNGLHHIRIAENPNLPSAELRDFSHFSRHSSTAGGWGA